MKRRSTILTAALAVLIIVGLAAWRWGFGGAAETGSAASVWSERADLTQQELTKSFWDEKRGLFNNAAPCIAQLCTDPFNYWWMAHAVDVLTDGYERTGDMQYVTQLDKLYQGLLDRNAGVFINDYYDDMEWMALAWLHAFDATGDDRYQQAAMTLWQEIQTGWNDAMGGGIAWRKEQLDYKNTPANAPAIILAARVYTHTKADADLAWAKKLYDWEKSNLVDPDTGLVWDGINRQGDGAVDKDWKFTYGQGVFIGAGVELYQITKEQRYLDDARKTAANLKQDFLSPATGMLPSEGEGDGGLFKGVLVRYIGELLKLDPSQTELREMLLTNADSLWNYGKDKDKALFSNSWAQTPDAVVQLSTELSAVMLLEQAARIEKQE
ncbi:putative alpha-1,6-mannanase (GH76 family) [Paenibacillus taihuensis]|uniref:Putative alpha-1,6-mannanase (GH76 family) n=1 Tax=Paenibacillus taihuensis TaxID=1156355 RepID=A0A3D9S724_9BACL|nr:glycoside hydrolase family 76 protein [Paenibacillus taihuensis]REE86398.1 putative alpha-1,6-mannanase (GH76 family) [Paenibacillus taihuensis]